jgi:putative hydrolase of the HAD superfamily
MITAVIFDCFGVLVGKGFEHTYRSAGGDPLRDRAFIEDMLGQTNLGIIAEADFHQAIATQLGISLNEWFEAVRLAEQPDAQLLAYIQRLRPAHKTAVLSNANTGVVAYKIGEEQLQACFDAVVVSADIGMVKPDPRIYEYTASKLGVTPAECVFIDDRSYFLEPAREVGMQTVLYQDYEQVVAELDKLLA